ncbi:hypothetical protein DF147_26325 [Burkholderia cenocepacia]|nr:hypothetical protein DF147_26325 [Burkholderia cenocepacia]RQV88777.1 hypothetical protein DF019_17225 [Burkholderia cenocepacia]
MNFMRIDFCEDFALRSPSDAHDAVPRGTRRCGDFRQKAVFIDHCRSISRITGHHNIVIRSMAWDGIDLKMDGSGWREG